MKASSRRANRAPRRGMLAWASGIRSAPSKVCALTKPDGRRDYSQYGEIAENFEEDEWEDFKENFRSFLADCVKLRAVVELGILRADGQRQISDSRQLRADKERLMGGFPPSREGSK